MNDCGYVVESPIEHPTTGQRIGTTRVYVGTEARAVALAAEVSERTWRKIPLAEIPFAARENLERSRIEG